MAQDASFKAWLRYVCRGIGLGRRYTAWREERFARIPDAYFAALPIEHGCEWISTDHDFAAFPASNRTTRSDNGDVGFFLKP